MNGYGPARAESVAFLSTYRGPIILVLAVTAPLGALLVIITMARNGKLARIYARRLTDLAVFIAGRKRLSLREEWSAHLAGNDGRELPPQEKHRAASGFARAAVRYRLRDAYLQAWKPIDAVLGSRPLSNMFVGGPVIVVLVAIVHHDGRFGLVADVQDPVALGAFLYGVIRTGRWWRGVKPPEPKAKRARSDGGNR